MHVLASVQIQVRYVYSKECHKLPNQKSCDPKECKSDHLHQHFLSFALTASEAARQNLRCSGGSPFVPGMLYSIHPLAEGAEPGVWRVSALARCGEILSLCSLCCYSRLSTVTFQSSSPLQAVTVRQVHCARLHRSAQLHPQAASP